MALFGASSSSPATEASPSSDQVKQQLKEQISQELAFVNASELVNKISQNCFDKCIQAPQDLITDHQITCTNQCLQKYLLSWNVISKAYIARIQNEKV